MNAPLEVDGDRPAVAWVSELPADWLTIGDRFVLLAIACDSYDGKSAAPGHANLSAWTGIQQSTVRAIVGRLCEPTAKRPALLRREQNRGHYRATLVLLRPELPAEQVGTLPADLPAEQPGTLADPQPADIPADSTGTFDENLPSYLPTYLPSRPAPPYPLTLKINTLRV
jgi:hypothetical protein